MAARLIAIVALLTFATGCCGPITGLYPLPQGEASREIFVVNNHWHTGLVIAWPDLSPAMQKYLSRFSDAKYLEIGWGDEGFYRAEKGTFGLAVRAAFASRGSVLHVVGLTREPAEHYRDFIVDLYRIQISEEGLRRLNRFLESTFATNSAGDSIPLQPGLYGVSYFYQARGRYSAFHTCNNWLADGVRSTGFPISPFYAATANNVCWQIRVFGRKYQSDVVVRRQ